MILPKLLSNPQFKNAEACQSFYRAAGAQHPLRDKNPDPEELLNFLEFDPVATYLFCAAAEKLG
jgi:hypothetical protein